MTAGVVHYGPTDYRLSRLPEEQCWEIERFRVECSGSQSAALLQNNWSIASLHPGPSAELARQLKVREWLMERSHNVRVPEGLTISEEFDSYLFAQCDLGELHRSIIESPRLVRCVLLGKDVGLRPERDDFPAGRQSSLAVGLD